MTKGQRLLAVVRCCFGIALVFSLWRKVLEFGRSCYRVFMIFIVFFFLLFLFYERKSVFIACYYAKEQVENNYHRYYLASKEEVKVENASHTRKRVLRNGHGASHTKDECIPFTHIIRTFSQSVNKHSESTEIMLAIKKSENNTPSCAVNVLPCRIQHNGPVNASTRHWTPQASSDGKSNTAYFRGRKLNGTVVSLPDGYTGM
jgi:hypothetical protein